MTQPEPARTKSARPALALGLATMLAMPPVSANAQEAELTDDELTYECAMALEFAAKKQVRLPVSAENVKARFSKATGNDPAVRQRAEKAVAATWRGLQKDNGSGGLSRYILAIAQDCSDQYNPTAAPRTAAAPPAAAPPAAAREGEMNALGTLSAASLRAYAQRTGDYGAVADYLVYHYPYGKDLFKDNADGDLLSKIIVEQGAAGLRKWSDEAVYAIANKFYWQYNPPATRLIFAEYQRRMRVMRQTEAEAQRWAQRAADDRAAQARQANARPVGSLGSGRSSSPSRGSGVYSCTTYKGTGGGRVCTEDK